VADTPGSEDLISELASKLGALRDAGGLEPLDLAGRARLLRIARDIAHATERQNAPLAAFLIGRFVQGAMLSGVTQSEALDEAASVVRSLIGDGAD
jgi:hypothetical protein